MTFEKLNFAPVSRFYQENDQKIILVIVVLLSLYLISFAAKLTWQIIPSKQAVDPSFVTSSQASGNVGSQNNKTNLNQLLALNLFGDATAKPQEPAQQDVTEAPETKLNLLLAGVVSSPDPSLGAAVIQYRNNQATYGVGDKIEGTQVTLDEIYSDRVIIKNRVTRETLMLDGVDFEEANRLREQNQAITRQSNPAQGPIPQNSGPSSRLSDPELIAIKQQLRENPSSFADFIRLTPHKIEGQPAGFVVSPGSDAALFREVGLQEGDIVVQMNGYDLSDPMQALEAAGLIQEAQNLEFDVLRNDELITLYLDIPRD